MHRFETSGHSYQLRKFHKMITIRTMELMTFHIQTPNPVSPPPKLIRKCRQFQIISPSPLNSGLLPIKLSKRQKSSSSTHIHFSVHTLLCTLDHRSKSCEKMKKYVSPIPSGKWFYFSCLRVPLKFFDYYRA